MSGRRLPAGTNRQFGSGKRIRDARELVDLDHEPGGVALEREQAPPAPVAARRASHLVALDEVEGLGALRARAEHATSIAPIGTSGRCGW